MKVFNPSIMLTVHLNYLLLLSSLVAYVCSYPFNTLAEKNKEISWEAWLLVDDQNQNRQVHEAQTPKRRITAKSVFVAPTFSPENLPPCSEGYSSDPLGRCVKIIKLDEDKHLDFLVSKLNEKFGSSLDYETMIEIDESNSQPTRLNIPLGSDYEDDDYSNDTPQEELDMAIIVTPTTRETDTTKRDDNSKVGKRDENVNGEALEAELKGLAQSPSTMKHDDYTALSVETTEMTTLETTTAAATTLEDEAETTSFTDSTTLLETTTDTPVATRKITTTTPKITTYHPVATTYHPYFDLHQLGGSRTRNFVKFPREEAAVPRSHPNGDYVRFPDVDSKYQQESLTHHTRDVDEQTGNFFNEIVTPQPSQRVHDLALPPKGEAENYFSTFNYHKSSGGFYPKFFPARDDPNSFITYQTATTERHPIKKPLFHLPPKWSAEEHRKPIVLRSLPMDDLTYLFGYKNGHASRTR